MFLILYSDVLEREISFKNRKLGKDLVEWLMKYIIFISMHVLVNRGKKYMIFLTVKFYIYKHVYKT